MLDRDLARLYGVETFRLNEQVKRNIERFPEDFMFQLSKEEFENLKSQIAFDGAKILNIFANHQIFFHIIALFCLTVL